MVYFNEQLKKYCKICPSCQKDIPYFTKKAAKRFDNEISFCRSCSQKNKKSFLIGEKNPNFGKKDEKHPKFVKMDGVYKNKNLHWCRLCPICKKELSYKNRSQCLYRQRRNNMCASCIHSFRKRNPCSDQTKEKIRKSNLITKYTPEFKAKMRISTLLRIKNQGTQISFNPLACKFIDDFGKKYGYNFRHAQNGGEMHIIGYYLDGYDKNKNTIFEYDESEHEKSRNKLKDLKRTENLIKKLDCNIIRYSEKFNRLYKSFPTYSEIWYA